MHIPSFMSNLFYSCSRSKIILCCSGTFGKKKEKKKNDWSTCSFKIRHLFWKKVWKFDGENKEKDDVTKSTILGCFGQIFLIWAQSSTLWSFLLDNSDLPKLGPSQAAKKKVKNTEKDTGILQSLCFVFSYKT